MNRTSIEDLATETLYGGRIGPSDACFRTNEAGIELANCELSALDVIENIIEEKVRPSIADSEIHEDFVGLNYLVGAYIVIGVREGDERVFRFLRQQPKVIQIEAINCSSTFFFKTGESYNFGVAPNFDLLEFLQSLTASTDGEIAQLAREVHEELVSAQRCD